MVMLVTDAFVRSVDEQLAVISASAFEPVYIPHPIASLPPEEVWKKADAALPEVVARLVDGQGVTARPVDGGAGLGRSKPPRYEDRDEGGASPTPAAPSSALTGEPAVCAVDAGPDCEECAVDAAERGL